MSIQFHTVTRYSRLAAAILFIFIVPALMFYIGRQYQATVDTIQSANHAGHVTTVQNVSPAATQSNPLNGTYIIDDVPVMLVNGVSEHPAAPGSASMNSVKVFGQPVYGDLNGDGLSDVAFFLTQTSGGSGTFFYVAVALNTGTSYQSLPVFSIGDRIAPQGMIISNDVITANYATRKDSEPMSTQPSVGVTKYLVVRNGQVVEVSK